MTALIHELPPIVLPMNIHKHGGKLLHLRRRYRRAADAAAALTVGADAPLQNKLAVISIYLIVGKPRLRSSSIKHRRNDAFFCPAAHKLPAYSLTEDSADRVYDDGFARAGFAGEHIKSRREADVSLFNYSYILNVKFIKHTALPHVPSGNPGVKTTALSRGRTGAQPHCRAWQ